MKASIRFNAKLKKFEALIGEKVVSRASTKLACQRTLLKKYGAHDVADSSSVVGEAPAKSKESMFKVNERFEFIDKFVQLIARKSVSSLVISGPGGLGKTYQVTESLKKRGLKEETIGSEGKVDYVVVKGYSTAKYMYRTLFDHNGMIVIFDDCDSVLKDPIGINILKGALESGDKRVITWGAEFPSGEELPNRFEFTGRVIFISNLSLEKIPQALISRSLRVDLEMSTEEKVERIETVMKAEDFGGYKHVDAEKAEVLAFIKKNATKFTDLNIRSAQNILKIRIGLEKDWERLALYMAMS